MKYFGISFLDKFHCSKGVCPKTCCKGWQILVDAKTMEKIEQEPADRRKTLLRNIKGQKTDSPQIRKRLGSCPYHTGEGLCGLQQEGRTDLMPRVCREYPRRTISYEAFAEIALELACPEVARLFLEEKEPLSMLPWQKEEREILWKIGNEDLPFLEFLQELRQTMVDEAQTQERFDVALLYRQYRCFDAMHEHLMRDKRAEANAVLDAYRNRCQESRRVGEQEDLDAGAPRQMLFFPMDLVDKVIAHQLDLPNLAVNNAYLKKCIWLYYRLCNDKRAEEAGAFFEKIWQEMEEEMPGTYDKYRKYYIYYLYEMLLCVYEDYHLLKTILLGNMYLELYMVMDAIAWLDCKKHKVTYDLDLQVRTLSSLERRMRHNTGVTDGILSRVRKDFL